MFTPIENARTAATANDHSHAREGDDNGGPDPPSSLLTEETAADKRDHHRRSADDHNHVGDCGAGHRGDVGDLTDRGENGDCRQRNREAAPRPNRAHRLPSRTGHEERTRHKARTGREISRQGDQRDPEHQVPDLRARPAHEEGVGRHDQHAASRVEPATAPAMQPQPLGHRHAPCDSHARALSASARERRARPR